MPPTGQVDSHFSSFLPENIRKLKLLVCFIAVIILETKWQQQQKCGAITAYLHWVALWSQHFLGAHQTALRRWRSFRNDEVLAPTHSSNGACERYTEEDKCQLRPDSKSPRAQLWLVIYAMQMLRTCSVFNYSEYGTHWPCSTSHTKMGSVEKASSLVPRRINELNDKRVPMRRRSHDTTRSAAFQKKNREL